MQNKSWHRLFPSYRNNLFCLLCIVSLRLQALHKFLHKSPHMDFTNGQAITDYNLAVCFLCVPSGNNLSTTAGPKIKELRHACQSAFNVSASWLFINTSHAPVREGGWWESSTLKSDSKGYVMLKPQKVNRVVSHAFCKRSTWSSRFFLDNLGW